MRSLLFLLLTILGLSVPANADYLYVFYDDDTYLPYIRESDGYRLRDNSDCYYYAADFVIDLVEDEINSIDFIECEKTNGRIKRIKSRSLIKLWDEYNSKN